MRVFNPDGNECDIVCSDDDAQLHLSAKMNGMKYDFAEVNVSRFTISIM